ncbi:hypothetical protein OG2516_04214 [Oceanicola granulosus HTCC2516]|uniref:DUF7742 domain-containing protein n=1 Tax=Oceanicola granulosus (strain ATCC BAA-861 / DSM 15982 / KCTC 12143 / HTCC2516) TaxID=314256 RepID=Q2CEC6_OCEGH|nr:hypothetical protein [Oceanicola granulosus]EAR51071.1 hypothetical protein OG2516_04214 [Oceanicola granulosus HTCC2516]
MRPLLPGDLDTGVRALLAVPPARRPPLARRLVAAARAAERHRAVTGKAHPRHGTGSLASAAMTGPLAPLPGHCDRAYRACLALLIEACRSLP